MQEVSNVPPEQWHFFVFPCVSVWISCDSLCCIEGFRDGINPKFDQVSIWIQACNSFLRSNERHCHTALQHRCDSDKLTMWYSGRVGDVLPFFETEVLQYSPRTRTRIQRIEKFCKMRCWIQVLSTTPFLGCEIWCCHGKAHSTLGQALRLQGKAGSPWPLSWLSC